MGDNSAMEPIKRKIKSSAVFFPNYMRVAFSEKREYLTGTEYRSFVGIRSFVPKTAQILPSKGALSIGHVSTSDETSSWKMGKWIIFILVVCIALVPSLFPVRRHSNLLWPLKDVSEELYSNILEQDEAIGIITDSLNDIFSKNDTEILVFSGSTGVGKSLASKIIQERYPWKKDIYFETAESFSSENLPKPLIRNFLVIEDCRERLIPDIVKFINRNLDYAQQYGNPVFILLIFTNTSKEALAQLPSSIPANFYFVPFGKLSENAVRKCIEKEIQLLNLQIKSTELDKLVAKQMQFGCKNVDVLIVHWQSRSHRPYDYDDSDDETFD